MAHATGEGPVKTVAVKIVALDAKTVEARIPDRLNAKPDSWWTKKFVQQATEDHGALYARACAWVSERLKEISENARLAAARKAPTLPAEMTVMFAEDGTQLESVKLDVK
jgi:hypothetical protein